MVNNYITGVDLDIDSHISTVLHSIAFQNVWRDRLENAFAPLRALRGIVQETRLEYDAITLSSDRSAKWRNEQMVVLHDKAEKALSQPIAFTKARFLKLSNEIEAACGVVEPSPGDMLTIVAKNDLKAFLDPVEPADLSAHIAMILPELSEIELRVLLGRWGRQYVAGRGLPARSMAELARRSLSRLMTTEGISGMDVLAVLPTARSAVAYAERFVVYTVRGFEQIERLALQASLFETGRAPTAAEETKLRGWG